MGHDAIGVDKRAGHFHDARLGDIGEMRIAVGFANFDMARLVFGDQCKTHVILP